MYYRYILIHVRKQGRKETAMTKVDGKSIEIINSWYEQEKRNRKMEKELKQQRRFELTSDGIDPEIAQLMVDFDLDLF